MTTKHEHDCHVAEALEHFYDQHGDCSRWSAQEWVWHDKMIERINKEDGVLEENPKT